ncbi:hypothetical protein CBOM_07443 [Ceraceosorus bombacis]|uniref:Uncharacterized protein n=1 Tax=Ceraceosorus bombacis TaxID=401625 RepID=A0A0P1B996_9BASI|nr:hypothetical protein CBOM_07443 [Ceraceosorus bombacis]
MEADRHHSIEAARLQRVFWGSAVARSDGEGGGEGTRAASQNVFRQAPSPISPAKSCPLFSLPTRALDRSLHALCTAPHAGRVGSSLYSVTLTLRKSQRAQNL